MATAILLGVVTAITSAIIAGQQHALEAQERVAATLAAEALLGRIVAEPYDSLPNWHGFNEDPGTMTDEFGDPMPDSFNGVGREVVVERTFTTLDPPDVNIRGRTVRVRAFDVSRRRLVELVRFVPEPQEDAS